LSKPKFIRTCRADKEEEEEEEEATFFRKTTLLVVIAWKNFGLS
jgi:hypothetical protein